jgi:hypothetical protein
MNAGKILFGAIFVIYGVLAFVFNFQIWNFHNFLSMLNNVNIWNPLGQFIAQKISGNIPILSNDFAILIRGFVALCWSAGFVIVGASMIF